MSDPARENCPPVDCTKNPSDTACHPIPPCTEGSSDCPTPPCQPTIGISCPPTPECKSDEHLENGKCVKNGPGPDDDCLLNPNLSNAKQLVMKITSVNVLKAL
jgi:hypothetical protein